MATARTELERMFTVEDREAIAAAIRSAEGITAGEVVPYVVGRCDSYRGAAWSAAAWGGVIGAAVSGLVHWLGGYWASPAGLWSTVPVVLGACAGYALTAGIPALRRLLTPPSVLNDRTQRRAALAFLHEEVFATRERTGILIFLALFERRVVVLADAGINAKVDQEEWNGIVAELREEVRRGRPAEGLITAIGACGRLLAERKVSIRPDDRNELPDTLRMADE